MIENEKLQSFLSTIELSIKRLREYKDIDFKDFDVDWKTQDVVKMELQQGIQAAIDTGIRLISMGGFRHSDDYPGIFDVLAENQVIPHDFSEKMKEPVRFRNILVHEYFRLDILKVYEHLQNDPDILEQFAKYLIKFLT